METPRTERAVPSTTDMQTTGDQGRGPQGGGDGPLCTKCSRSTHPIYIGKYVHFECQNGHRLAVDDVIESEARSFDEALHALIREKEERMGRIHQMIRDAEARGAFQVAGVLKRQIEPMEIRLRMLRAAEASKRKPEKPGEKP